MISKIIFYSKLFVINNFLSTTRFFNLKRKLLNSMGLNIGDKTQIVGPIFINYHSGINIGNNCWVGKNLKIEGNGHVNILDNCDIGPDVTIGTGGHVIGRAERRAGKGVIFSTTIEEGSWIGMKSTIINGASVKKGTVVAACSLVIKDTEQNSLVAGVPATLKKVLHDNDNHHQE